MVKKFVETRLILYFCTEKEKIIIINIMAIDVKMLTLKTLTKSNVWELQENDVFGIWNNADKDADITENYSRFVTIIRTAFEIEEVKIDRPEIIKKYEARGMTVDTFQMGEVKVKYAIKKRPILRVTDLTYENIHHISAAKLLDVIDRNFGGGWESLAQSIKDIIESGFDISTTSLPKDRLRKPGGLYEKKVADGFEVLEIPKGLWVEAIFAKEKPELIKIKSSYDDLSSGSDADEDDDADVEIEDNYYKQDEDDDTYDEDKLTEESYRTTFDEDTDELSLDAADEGDDDDF